MTYQKFNTKFDLKFILIYFYFYLSKSLYFEKLTFVYISSHIIVYIVNHFDMLSLQGVDSSLFKICFKMSALVQLEAAELMVSDSVPENKA